jgi:hypothetical protein
MEINKKKLINLEILRHSIQYLTIGFTPQISETTEK